VGTLAFHQGMASDARDFAFKHGGFDLGQMKVLAFNNGGFE